MFERFTDRARKVMALSNQAAQLLNHDYIGTEHILLGLIKEGSGIGAGVLKAQNVDLGRLRDQVLGLVRKGTDEISVGKLPQTPGAKDVIKYAIEEARSLNHNYVSTEHLLLGLLRVEDGVAAQALWKVGAKLEDCRKEIVNLLGAADDLPPYSSKPIDEIDEFIHKAIQQLALAWDRAFCKRDRVLADDIRAHIERLHAVLTKRQSPPAGPESKNDPGTV